MHLKRVPCNKLQIDMRVSNSDTQSDDIVRRIKTVNKSLRRFRVQYDRSLPSCDAVSGEAPRHFVVYESPYTDEELSRTFDVCDDAYRKMVKMKNAAITPAGKVSFIFDNMTVDATLKFLAKNGLRSLETRVADLTSKLKGVFQAHPDFEKRAKFVMVRYGGDEGLHMHVDNVRRSGGAIASMHVGPDHGQYVMGSLNENERSKTVVLTTRKGDISVMQGESRFDWAHGLPYGFPFTPKKVRYTFLFLIGKNSAEQCGKYYSSYWSKTFPTYICN